MEYLGSYKITPNTAEIEVDCYGSSYPAQRETLEQEGFNAYREIERVYHNGLDIIDYLSDNDLDKLKIRCNEK